MSSNSTTLEGAFSLLSIETAIFASLSALFGVYFVLFILAMWATFRKSSKAYTRLRIITLVLFLNLCIHYAVRALTIAQDRLPTMPDDELLAWYIPIVFIGSITTTLAGFISDGLLAWRLYVIWGRSRWALWLPIIGVVLTALLGFVSGFQHLQAYRSVSSYWNHYQEVAFQLYAAWGWVMFGTNTMMTMSIIGRIIYVSREVKVGGIAKSRMAPYRKLVEAIVESALVTWFGLVFYGIATVAPQGHITTDLDVGFVMICIIPIFFGISQCLITVRLGLASTQTPESPSSRCTQTIKFGSSGRSKGVVVSIEQVASSDHGPSDLERALERPSDSEGERVSVNAV